MWLTLAAYYAVALALYHVVKWLMRRHKRTCRRCRREKDGRYGGDADDWNGQDDASSEYCVVETLGDLDILLLKAFRAGRPLSTRALVVGQNAREPSQPDLLVLVLAAMPLLEELHFQVSNTDRLKKHKRNLEVPVKALSFCPRLSKVSFNRLILNLVDIPRLEHLTELCLVGVRAHPKLLADLLAVRFLPSLQALVLARITNMRGNTQLVPEISLSLLSQLDVLQLDLEKLPLVPHSVLTSPACILFDAAGKWSTLSGNKLEHVKYISVPDLHLSTSPDRLRSAPSTLDALTRVVLSDVRAPARLTLYVPHDLYSPTVVADEHREFRLAREKLFAACSERDVRVVWRTKEDWQDKEMMYPRVCEAFWAAAKAEKDARRTEKRARKAERAGLGRDGWW
ncbi:hypothetical protein JCM10450v2_003337 [Rhodotorula kratochvilovae]